MKISLVLRFFFFFLWHYNYITLPLHIWKKAGFIIGEGNGNPLQCSCLENPRDGGAWWAAVYGVAQSRTRLKRLCSSSSNICIFYVMKIYKFISWSPRMALIHASSIQNIFLSHIENKNQCKIFSHTTPTHLQRADSILFNINH